MTIVIAANLAKPDVGSMNTPTIDEPEEQLHESTYALLMRSEERSRNVFELVIYPLLIIGAIIAICQFVLQTADMPPGDRKAAERVTSAVRLHSPS